VVEKPLSKQLAITYPTTSSVKPPKKYGTQSNDPQKHVMLSYQTKHRSLVLQV